MAADDLPIATSGFDPLDRIRAGIDPINVMRIDIDDDFARLNDAISD